MNYPAMVIKGRSRTNGRQLADYLLNNRENDRAQVLDVRGTSQPDNVRRSLVEMSLSSELTKRGKLGLYHAQVNPAIGEDRPMSAEDWHRAADILEDRLGLTGQKRVIVLHEKAGRVHGHIVWERYDHDTGRLRTDSRNYEKHDQARAQIEQTLNHERTPQKAHREPTDRERLTQLWEQHPDGKTFVEAAQEAGYTVCQGNDRRPFRVITADGQSLDLTRQLEGIRVKAVRDRLQPIRDQLPTEANALQQPRESHAVTLEAPAPAPQHSDHSQDLSERQDIAAAMIERVRESRQTPDPPALPQPPAEKTQPDNTPELSESYDRAEAMLQRYRQRQAELQERQRKAQEMRQQAREQTRRDAPDPSLTDNAADLLERYRQRQRDRGRGCDGLEY